MSVTGKEAMVAFGCDPKDADLLAEAFADALLEIKKLDGDSMTTGMIIEGCLKRLPVDLDPRVYVILGTAIRSFEHKF